MVQLNQFPKRCSGAFRKELNGGRVRFDGAKPVDLLSMVGRMRNDRGDDDIFVKKGPFFKPVDSLLFNLNRRDQENRNSPRARGLHRCLRLFTEWAGEHETDEGPQFVFAHPDFDHQNLLVDDDGSLSGIIDWDGVAAVPHSVGCLAYPKWLSRDWDPHNYNYDPKTGGRIHQNWRYEDCPKDLTKYRAMYTHFVEVALAKYGMDPLFAEVTSMSPLTGSLEIADSDPMAIEPFLHNVFNRIESFVGDKPGHSTSNGEGIEADSTNSTEGSDSEEDEEGVEDVEEGDAGDNEDNEENVKCRKCIAEKMQESSDEKQAHAGEVLSPVAQDGAPCLSAGSEDSRSLRAARILCSLSEKGFRGAARVLYRRDKQLESGKASATMYPRNLIGQKLKEAAQALLNDQRVADTNASRKSEDGSIITLVASDLEHSEHCPKYEKEVIPPAASKIEESAAGARVGEAQVHIASNEKNFGMRATNFTQASAKVASWIIEKVVEAQKRGEGSRFPGTIVLWKKIKDNLLSIIRIARKAWKTAAASPGVEVVPTKATFGVINRPEVGNQDLRSVGHNGSSEDAGCPQQGDADSTTKPADVSDDKPCPRNKPCRCGSKHKYKKCCGKSKEPEQKDREGEVAGLKQQDGDEQFSGPKQVGDEDDVRDNCAATNEEEAVDTTHGDDDSSDSTPAADEGIVTQTIDTEFEYGDRGGFNMDDIFVALGGDKLDQEPYDRLKDGFMQVIASILGRI